MANEWFVRRETCPVCNFPGCTTIYSVPYDQGAITKYLESVYPSLEPQYLKGADYILCECGKCASIFQKEIPHDFLLERIYDHWSPPVTACQRQEQLGLKHYSNYAHEIMQIIAYFNRRPVSLSVLDYGMGWGHWALMAKAFGCDSYGSELSSERIRYALANGIKVVEPGKLPEAAFDLINTEQVFEHIPSPLATLLDLKRALKPGGLIKVSVPTATNIARRLMKMDWNLTRGRSSINPVAPLEHINFFRKSSLLQMAQEAGMEVVCIATPKSFYRFSVGARRMLRVMIAPVYEKFASGNYVFLSPRIEKG